MACSSLRACANLAADSMCHVCPSQVAELCEVYKAGGAAALAGYTPEPLAWEEVQAIQGGLLPGLPSLPPVQQLLLPSAEEESGKWLALAAAPSSACLPSDAAVEIYTASSAVAAAGAASNACRQRVGSDGSLGLGQVALVAGKGGAKERFCTTRRERLLALAARQAEEAS